MKLQKSLQKRTFEPREGLNKSDLRKREVK